LKLKHDVIQPMLDAFERAIRKKND
jgi:hypothetical protein